MSILSFARRENIELSENVSTATISSIRAGGIARYVAFPDTNEKLIQILRFLNRDNIKFKVIGRCTNVFFADTLFDGVLVSTSRLNKWRVIGNSVSAESGVSLPLLIRKLAHSGLELASELSGIPGSVGGAVRNNAGAFSKEIADVFVCADVYDLDKDKIEPFDKNDMLFAYRSSVLNCERKILLAAELLCVPNVTDAILGKISEYTRIRRRAQPTDASLGSFFKRAGEVIPAKLIDETGLKGLSCGKAAVSLKHAGFIINTGGATASDINRLAEMVEHAVYQKYGIVLERETEYIT